MKGDLGERGLGLIEAKLGSWPRADEENKERARRSIGIARHI